MTKRVWKPLDINGLRLYQVRYFFLAHPAWDEVAIVAATSPTHARRLIEEMHAETEWIEKPMLRASALNVYMPESWFCGEEDAGEGENEHG